MVLSNYEGKTGHTMGVIQVDMTVRSITRPTVFIVTTSKASYNQLIGQKRIHGVRVVPSSLHQRVEIGRNDGILVNIEAIRIFYGRIESC